MMTYKLWSNMEGAKKITNDCQRWRISASNVPVGTGETKTGLEHYTVA